MIPIGNSQRLFFFLSFFFLMFGFKNLVLIFVNNIVQYCSMVFLTERTDRNSNLHQIRDWSRMVKTSSWCRITSSVCLNCTSRTHGREWFTRKNYIGSIDNTHKSCNFLFNLFMALLSSVCFEWTDNVHWRWKNIKWKVCDLLRRHIST